MTQKRILVLAAIVLTVLGGGAWLFLGGPSRPVAGWEIHPTDRVLGNRQSPAVLIEYASPTCPHCAEFNDEVLPSLKREYIDTGKILYVLRAYMRSPADGAAEKLARCVPENRYFDAMDVLFRNQAIWSPDAGVLDLHGGLLRIGRMLGLEAGRVDTCLNSNAEDDRLNRQTAEAVERYGVTGVPTFVLNGGKVFEGIPSMPQLSQALEATLAAGKQP